MWNLKSFPIFAADILIAWPEKPKNERMLPIRPISNGVQAASFILRSGDFSDLSNELKRPARIAVLFIYQSNSLQNLIIKVISAPE